MNMYKLCEEIMEKKSLLQLFREAAGPEELKLADRVVKTLMDNRIISIDILAMKEPEEILAINGIGDKSMALINKVMAKRIVSIKDIQKAYKKSKKKTRNTLHEWFEDAGASKLEAANVEKILKNNGIKYANDILKFDVSQFENMPGIGEKRLDLIRKTRALMEK